MDVPKGAATAGVLTDRCDGNRYVSERGVVCLSPSVPETKGYSVEQTKEQYESTKNVTVSFTISVPAGYSPAEIEAELTALREHLYIRYGSKVYWKEAGKLPHVRLEDLWEVPL